MTLCDYTIKSTNDRESSPEVTEDNDNGSGEDESSSGPEDVTETKEQMRKKAKERIKQTLAKQKLTVYAFFDAEPGIEFKKDGVSPDYLIFRCSHCATKIRQGVLLRSSLRVYQSSMVTSTKIHTYGKGLLGSKGMSAREHVTVKREEEQAFVLSEAGTKERRIVLATGDESSGLGLAYEWGLSWKEVGLALSWSSRPKGKIDLREVTGLTLEAQQTLPGRPVGLQGVLGYLVY
ncbi:hypothetical protein FB446DRAFT_708461 [Lentinula raphanica]|nr:hypothetical protein FB446DRAFT_708461 [Lentinula raphanica]